MRNLPVRLVKGTWTKTKYLEVSLLREVLQLGLLRQIVEGARLLHADKQQVGDLDDCCVGESGLVQIAQGMVPISDFLVEGPDKPQIVESGSITISARRGTFEVEAIP